jgi:hypothetical protein
MSDGAQAQGARYFESLQEDKANFDPERFITEVDAIFHSEDIFKEVRWRINVLKEISANPELGDVRDGLRDRLTQIFSKGGEEAEILNDLKQLTAIQRADGGAVELRRFLKRAKRTLNEYEYRQILLKKIENTEFQMLNLIAFFPEARQVLTELTKATKQLIKGIKDPKIPIQKVKDEEDKIRQSAAFDSYEELKLRFLRDWLGNFTSLTREQIEGCSPEEIQQMVIEHQRHQMTALLKTKIVASDVDMTEHLGLHDTLECGFTEQSFWGGANQGVKNGFRALILAVIQSFGMLKGQRYSFFQSQDDETQYLLFGVGIKDIADVENDPIEMVPYIKPFTRKGGYLLEIRQREISDPEQYGHELRHYVLPFLFAFDQIPNFEVSKDLITFFTSNY